MRKLMIWDGHLGFLELRLRDIWGTALTLVCFRNQGVLGLAWQVLWQWGLYGRPILHTQHRHVSATEQQGWYRSRLAVSGVIAWRTPDRDEAPLGSQSVFPSLLWAYLRIPTHSCAHRQHTPSTPYTSLPLASGRICLSARAVSGRTVWAG